MLKVNPAHYLFSFFNPEIKQQIFDKQNQSCTVLAPEPP